MYVGLLSKMFFKYDKFVEKSQCQACRNLSRQSQLQKIFLITCGFIALTRCAVTAEGTSSDERFNCSSSGSSSSAGFISAERRLMYCLLRNYDTAVRPVGSPNEAVTVTLKNQLFKVIDLIEKDNVLITENWFRQEWKDVQLTWKPEDYGGVKEIMIPVDRIWIPNLVLLNNAGNSFGYIMGNLAVVNHTGLVLWAPHIRMESYCQLDLAHFPYDSQNCSLVFGTWSYDKSSVDIHIPPTYNENFYYDEGSEWSVIDYSAYRHEYPDTQSDPWKYYPVAIYSVKMQRSPTYYEFILVHPTRALTILTLLLFLLPHESTQRFILAGAILICLTILLVILEAFIPAHIDAQPVIGLYLAYNSVFVIIVIKISMITSHFQYKQPGCSPVPNYLRWILSGRLSRILCITKSSYSPIRDLSVEENFAQRELEDRLSTSNGPYRQRGGKSYDDQPQGPEEDGAALSPGTVQTLRETLEDLRRYLRLVSAQQLQQSQDNMTSHRQLVVEEWKQLAASVDRLMFLIFFIITVIVLIAIRISAS